MGVSASGKVVIGFGLACALVLGALVVAALWWLFVQPRFFPDVPNAIRDLPPSDVVIVDDVINWGPTGDDLAERTLLLEATAGGLTAENLREEVAEALTAQGWVITRKDDCDWYVESPSDGRWSEYSLSLSDPTSCSTDLLHGPDSAGVSNRLAYDRLVPGQPAIELTVFNF